MRAIIALGGNALQAEGVPATAECQLKTIKNTAVYLADMIENDIQIVIVHGNGPQVGRIVVQNEYAKSLTPPMPFDICGAMSQGMIGYHIQQALGEELHKRHIDKHVVTVITQTIVDENDKGFQHPTKPIGPYYSEAEAQKLHVEKGYSIMEDSGRGYRRIVASPVPQKIIEIDTIRKLVDNGEIVISAGGGGIPVVKQSDESLRGVTAVIDKDLAAAELADALSADQFIILTAVDNVAINFGKADQQALKRLTLKEAERYINEGQFGTGSMLPKIQAAMNFVGANPEKRAIVASLKNAKDALRGKSGTIIVA
ncbi:carbamate kinase [Pectinatus sottacetonis]|uniref:carbamate kinase n=1 Tax=Pectinatus sottacetonis TaxID=1002795 RepID=UPI0018C715AD|nr:carbamate kinase [Pectinatus sottacetonis]